MSSKSTIQLQEELESEKRFSLFSFYTQWSVYSIFLIFRLDFNLLATLQKKPNKKITLLNHLASFSLICFFTSIFSSIAKQEANTFLNWQLYYVAIAFTIIHESMRVHKYAYLLASFFSYIFYTIIAFTISDLANLEITYKFLIPYLFIAYCTFLGYYINKSKIAAISYYADLLQDKMAINRDMALARTVQESLFPKITSIKDLKFEIFRQSHNQIGGDFYDFIQLREGNVGIFITDVAGHGYSSAMVAAMLKVMVSTLPYYLKLDPTGLLGYIDQKISGEFKSHHATALYIFINFQTQTFLLGNAGHPYFIYAKKGEEFREIETFGTLLGFGLHDPVAETLEFKYESGLQILNQYRKETNLKVFKDSVISKIVSFYGKSEFTDDAMFLAFEIE